MRKSFLGISLALVLTLTLFPGFAPNVSAHPEQSDHALLNNGNLPGPDTAIYCGVETKKAEPWVLHIAASADSSGGTLSITFGGGDGISFNVPANGSFNTTQALGGVPGVDDVVKISVGGGTLSAMASALVARAAGKDPFADDDEKDNFCLTKPGDPGTVPF